MVAGESAVVAHHDRNQVKRLGDHPGFDEWIETVMRTVDARRGTPQTEDAGAGLRRTITRWFRQSRNAPRLS